MVKKLVRVVSPSPREKKRKIGWFDNTIVLLYGCTMKHMHIYVPEELYEKLREQAFSKKTTMSKLIVAQLNNGTNMVVAPPNRENLTKQRGKLDGGDYV